MKKPNHLLEAAVDYVRRGIKVFPCAPRGKKPLVKNGFHDAACDEAKVRKWWKTWPDANIGVPTGAENGIIVIDVDKRGDLSLFGREIPETVESATGGGGRHIIYKHPGRPVKNTTGANIGLDGVDSRADGGYIIVPPSIHESGDSYQWEISFDDMEPQEAPQWWLSLLASDRREGPKISSTPGKATSSGTIGEGGRNDYLASLAGKYRADGYGEERLFFALMGANLEQCNPPLDEEEVRTIAKSVGRYQTYEEEHAEEIALGEQAAASIWTSHQEEIAAEMGIDKTVKAEAPRQIVPSVGLIKDIVDFILSQSRFPRPVLAMAAAVSFLGALMGQKYKTETGLRTNVYFVGLAKSGSGKDAARKAIKRLAMHGDALDYLGEERLASGPGLIASLADFPKKWYPLDEFGRMLQSMTGKNADGYRREIITNFMQLYSSAGSVFQGTAYADRKKAPASKIVDPCCVVYGTSTHDSFFSSLSSAETVGGELARFIIVDAGRERGKAKKFVEKKPPEDLIVRIKNLAEFKGLGNLADVALNGVMTSNPITVYMTPEVEELWEELDNSMTDLMKDDAASSIYSRVAENTAKLALIYAVSLNMHEPRIDEFAFNWAREVALWSANLMMENINSHIADNEQEANSKKVARIIKGAGKDGLQRNLLTRATQFLKGWERDDIVQSLIDGKIVFKKVSKKSKRPAEVFVHIDFYDKSEDLLD
jgi:hypothetical protein